jgi:DNA-binding NarL/FixJ family response regulator
MKIMIADDHKILREGLKYMIENNSNFQVVALASDGQEAVNIIKTQDIDLIIMDISMPILSGIDAIKEIRKFNQNIPILVLTSMEDDINVSKAMLEGADGYVLKNISPEHLILSIQSVFAGMEVMDKGLMKSPQIVRVKEIGKDFSKIHLKVNGIDVTLNKKELQILKMIVDAKTIPQIAQEMYLAEGRIRNIISEMISKLYLNDKTHLAIFAIKSNLV